MLGEGVKNFRVGFCDGAPLTAYSCFFFATGLSAVDDPMLNCPEHFWNRQQCKTGCFLSGCLFDYSTYYILIEGLYHSETG